MEKEISDRLELLNALRKLNPSVSLDLKETDMDTIVSGIPAKKLILPKPFYYNTKNGITNKHETVTGMYIAIDVEYKI